jgi:NTP pyrophosphatase (non-canonical NTP hydrolase)
LNKQDPDWNSNPDHTPTENAIHWINNIGAEVAQAQDISRDMQDLVGMVGRELGVKVEPHQNYTGRLLDAIAGKPLSFQRMRETNARRCIRWHPGGIEEWSVSDWGVAMAGEAGDVCDAIKKLRRIETGAENKSDIQTVEQAHEAIGIELADTVLYCDLLAQRLGINLDEFIKRKFNSVSEKYGFPERL